MLSKAYEDSATRFGLILGTGVNIAAHLPVHLFGNTKFGSRPTSWHDAAKHVIVNTECSMFGKAFLPMTPWDHLLNDAHSKPDFQPLEYLVSSRYIGELTRIILQDAVRRAGLFEGTMPSTLIQPYTLDAELLANMEASVNSSNIGPCQLIALQCELGGICKRSVLSTAPTSKSCF